MLNIEYIPDTRISPTLLIYGWDPQKFALLRDAVIDLSLQAVNQIAIHDLPGFMPVEGCQLFFSVATADSGLRLIEFPNTLDCALQPLWWSNIETLLGPFAEPTHGNRFWSGSQSLTYGFYSPVELGVATSRDSW